MSSEQTKYIVEEEQHGQRLDVFLVHISSYSRGEVQKMIKHGAILLNGIIPKKSGEKLKVGDEVSIVSSYEEVALLEKNKQEKEFGKSLKDFIIPVIEDTKDYIVVNKPPGILTHPTQAGEAVSLAAWVLEHYPEVKGIGEYENRPGIVHRLDKDTSGLMVIAKNQKMFVSLKEQFKKRTVHKEYMVLVHGNIEAEHALLDFLIDRGTDGRMVARPKTNQFSVKHVSKIQPGKPAITEFWVKQRFLHFTLLSVKIHTGRTHQIRVHMYAYNHPVVGDPLYHNKRTHGAKDRSLGRLFLHSYLLNFQNLEGEPMEYSVDLPEELKEFLDTLK
ncbi:MAG: hypothetical protein COV59_01575 [Candidatus Magasanikbacteria bacterium CG11_big_fil_rev_8_21_14_0_20_39_34]|uniref:Pseudouridine synthase n=1 Tax=Candidatus Magasanikbacteria bacterium CG11_big_fil_rev_8_21_14_0_20_39_34 TaxID=1974653 RepID=A0A2H0N879_9BACT|nr:MAG: hypothetical protein COV59_01575 [Candidatus Magasanikbacteria bacterium CG11_big_fil_rev_8_21_14_0_20_39_34]